MNVLDTPITEAGTRNPIAGPWQEAAPKTVGEFAEFWLERIFPKRAPKPSYRRKIEGVVRSRIVPWLGERPLEWFDDTSAMEVEWFIEEFAREALEDGKIAPRTVRNWLRTAELIFDDAKRWGLVHANPFAGVVRRLRLNRRADDQVDDVSAMTQREWERFAEACRELRPDLWLHFSTIERTGLRVAEFIALDVADFDPERRELRVNKQVSTNDPILTAKPIGPKSRTSRRAIPLSRQLAKLLIEHVGDRTDGPLFPSPSRRLAFRGERTGYRLLQKAFDKIRDAAGLPGHFTLHSLRHTCAVRCIDARMDIRALAEMLGHSDPSITLRVYGRWLAPSTGEVLDRRDEDLENCLTGNSDSG